ncbi:MAG: SDR family oxidoreductase [Chloroflexi bacterium]|nr:SDR family oxidoreductase [Chloroflexota bacterium]
MKPATGALSGHFALILGASSGFGGATAVELARQGMHIFGVHLDRRATMPNVERIVSEIRSLGQEAHYFNMNAADPEKRTEVVRALRERVESDPTAPQQVKVLLHSLAFGTLKSFVSEDPKDQITQAQLEMTLDVMANSLIYWCQDLFQAGLLTQGSRVYAMTSAGSSRVLATYGAVSAAKAALESHVRQLSMELAHKGVTVNAIRAGVTDTPALRRIPVHDYLIGRASTSNPSGRMTTPEDIARAIVALAQDGTYWMTGNVLGVDGGEDAASW